MSLFPCGYCQERAVGQKLCSATWAWWRADNQRVAFRQRLCNACVATNVAPLAQPTRDEPLKCPVCHTDPQEAMDPTYLTIFLPGHGPERLEMATCGPCAVEVRNRGQRGAVRLENRPLESGGQESGPQTDDPDEFWRQLGVLPRE